jgi:RHS repeat-associated protein
VGVVPPPPHTVIADQPQAGATTRAAIDSIGDRLCTSTGSGFGWTVADLHGNVAGQTEADGSPFLDVLRYDAYGKAVGSPGTPSSVPTPWRFQGRILEYTSGSDAYDFDARSYLPDLGTFTSLDSVTGSAQNPLSLNRYLYAEANPATFIDPSGHCVKCQITNVDGAPDHQSDVVRYLEKTGDIATATRLLAPEAKKCSGLLDCAGAFAAGLFVTVASAPYFPLLCALDLQGCAKDILSTPQSIQDGVAACTGGDWAACGALAGAAITLGRGGKAIASALKGKLKQGAAANRAWSPKSYRSLLWDEQWNPLGVASKSGPRIRELPGGQTAAQSMFQQLTQGGSPASKPGYPGTMVQMPDGTWFGFRIADDGVPTIDVNVPGNISIKKLKFP